MDDFEFDSESIAFKDFFTNIACVFLLALGLVLAFINPTAKEESAEITSPGTMMVEVYWPDDMDVDVDVWVVAPTEPKPVGYSNKQGKIWNLLRDDVGHKNDISKRNFENVYTRGMPAGEYQINVHMYSTSPTWPVPVKVIVSVRESGSNKGQKQIIMSDVELKRQNQELTVARFRVDQNQKFIPESVNNRFKALYGGTP